ncbi:FtsK/SpoIIIE domain-containing protein [Halostreptopolyspora alba]|uniref:FtsK/SpoIIIE domain-containing protein n=1 Tax=Halostreptopolyspora alba TaxID=2487137 RepID=UPI003718E129
MADRIRAQMVTASHYARLGWIQYWEVSLAYVMDPQVRTETHDAVEAALDAKRVAAAKRKRRAVTAEEKRAAEREVQRLEHRVASELEVDARTLAARASRLARRLALPAGIALVPPWLAVSAGVWPALLAWPAAWLWLALQGRARTMATEGSQDTAGNAAGTAAMAPTGLATSEGEDRWIGATDVETRILRRLDAWGEQAGAYSLSEITPTAPTLDASGIRVVLTLAGEWTPSKLRSKQAVLRSMLQIPTEMRVEIAPGASGHEAVVRIRTRDREVDVSWTPARHGIGIDADSGETVEMSPYQRLLVAGESGSGKSVALRPLLARVAADPHGAVVYLDAKRVEAALWRGKARLARTPEEIREVAAEVRAEMDDRLALMEARQQASWDPTPKRPRMVVVIDEGTEVIAAASEALASLRSIAMMGRAAEIHMWWCTQKPVMSGHGKGIDPQIAAQMGVQICLRVASAAEARTVLGEQATAQGWDAHELPAPGAALIRGIGRGPHPVFTWHATDDDIKTLPEVPAWHRPTDTSQEENTTDTADTGPEPREVLDVALRLCGDAQGIRADQIAAHVDLDVLDIQETLKALGVPGGRFYGPDGSRQRGFRREDLEAAEESEDE